jgi:hypothetical protein
MESSIISPPFRIAFVHAKRGLTNAFAVSFDCLDLAIGTLRRESARLSAASVVPLVQNSGSGPEFVVANAKTEFQP